ncbi:MAG: HPP family protein [Desulfobacterales bacterium]|jgi:CBS-domain-containing membrane protein
MTPTPPRAPQHTLFFRIVAFFSRLQFWYLIRKIDRPHTLLVLFIFIAGAVALGTISIVAYLTRLPLLFPQLGPSAFILFHTPMSVTASPRNVLLSHTLAVASGLFALWLVGWIYPEAGLSDPFVLNWYRILVIALTMGAAGVIMVLAKCIHPPAAASALIAAMGFLNSPEQVLGVIGAMILLVLEAILFNRIIGGLPYPLWRADPKAARTFGAMAGIPDSETNFWRHLATKTLQRRGP